MTVDGFYTNEAAKQIASAVFSLPYTKSEFGEEIENFNMIDPDIDEMFSAVMGKKVAVDQERSGVFRRPTLFIHFESFQSPKEWVFVVALENSTFNIFEHQGGAKSALDGYQHNYRNLFEWDLTVNHLLEPGQGVFFRPWMFHTFDMGLVQTFRIREE